MSVKVAINGFCRIGRLAFRQMFGAEGYEVVAINDPVSYTHLDVYKRQALKDEERIFTLQRLYLSPVGKVKLFFGRCV